MSQIGDGLIGALDDVNTTFVTDQFSQFNLLDVQETETVSGALPFVLYMQYCNHSPYQLCVEVQFKEQFQPF